MVLVTLILQAPFFSRGTARATQQRTRCIRFGLRTYRRNRRSGSESCVTGS